MKWLFSLFLLISLNGFGQTYQKAYIPAGPGIVVTTTGNGGYTLHRPSTDTVKVIFLVVDTSHYYENVGFYRKSCQYFKCDGKHSAFVMHGIDSVIDRGKKDRIGLIYGYRIFKNWVSFGETNIIDVDLNFKEFPKEYIIFNAQRIK